MKNRKIYILVALFALFLSCDEDKFNPVEDEKYAELDTGSSIIPNRVQFGVDRIYHYKIGTVTNYLKEDGFSVTGKLINGTDSIDIMLYDDGISDDSLRNDIAASNGIWSGGINGLDIPKEGEWNLQVSFLLAGEREIGNFSSGIVYAVINSVPEIGEVNGLSILQIFESGFDTKTITVAVSDSNNLIAPYDEQILKMGLYNSLSIKLKENLYTRQNAGQDFTFDIDSTYAAGIPFSRNYKIKLTATDIYGESAYSDFVNITIKNGPPSIYNLQYPDTIFVPADSTLFVDFAVKVNVNDPQGHLEYQDIEEVLITTNSSRQMRDNGIDLDAIANDGIYTIAYTVNSSFFPDQQAMLNFSIEAFDKAGNHSTDMTGTFVFIKTEKKSVKRGINETTSNYFDPFSSK